MGRCTEAVQSFRRLSHSAMQTEHVAADYALSAGWGATASVAVTAGSNDSRGRITITSAGTGQAANPTCTLTFKDGAWESAPFAIVRRSSFGSQPTINFSWTPSTSTLVMTLVGTPVAADTYQVDFSVRG